MLERVEIRLSLEQFLKRLAPQAKDGDIEFTVFNQFSLEIEDGIAVNLLLVPMVEFLLFLFTRGLRHVGFFRWHGAHVLLIFHSVP